MPPVIPRSDISLACPIHGAASEAAIQTTGTKAMKAGIAKNAIKTIATFLECIIFSGLGYI